MKKVNSDKIQKYSLRKYKGIGAASVLLGMMVVGASPVSAEENTPKESTVTPAKENVEMETLSNSAGSYTMPKMHVFNNGLGNFYIHEYDYVAKKYYPVYYTGEQWAEYNFKNVEKTTIKKQGLDIFKDTKISYVTKEDKKIKSDSDVENSVENDKVTSISMDYKIRGLFGKRYEGETHTLTSTDLDKIREADKIIKTNEGVYHKITTKVEKQAGTMTETTFNDITVHANPNNLHNEDGSIRYNDIKEGSRVWLVSEIDEGKYGKYVLATKTTGANDTWATETFKKGEDTAKDFTNENIRAEGGIKEGDTILVVEKNEVALREYGASTATEKQAYTAGAYFNEKALENGLVDLFETRAYELKHEREVVEGKPKTWGEIYKNKLVDEARVDEKKRPIYSLAQDFYGYIREKDGIKAYYDIENYISKLKEKFGDREIRTGWDQTRDIVEPKFDGNIDEYKDTVNYEREKQYVTKIIEVHKNIQYVEKVPIDATFVKNVFEVDVKFKYGDRSTDIDYPNEEVANLEDTEKKYLAYAVGVGLHDYRTELDKSQYGLGHLYKEFEKNGIIYRIASATKDDQYTIEMSPHSIEIHYYDLYQPTRAYHISDKLTNIKNIYAKEETETTESKGNVIVKYQLANGTSIKESADVVKDAVISSTETKYYLDKDNQKVIVGTPTTTNKDVSYDATTIKLPEITKDGKKYKLVGLKDESSKEKGNVVAGTTEITYVYKLATTGNVFVKYMLEGTTTEIAEGKVLKQDASIGDEYTATAPKLGTVIKKDGKSYFYKGHRVTSAPETGIVDENEKTVIYDFVEYFSGKGDLEVQPALPEGVVSEKGEPEVYPVAPLLITRHIIIGLNEELVPTEEGHFTPKQGIITKNGKQYQYVSTHEEDGITTHYYQEITSESRTNVPEGNATSPTSSPTAEVERSSEESLGQQQETPQNNTEEIHSNELPKTGQAELLPTWLGFLSLIGGVFIRRKNNKDNF